MFSISSMLSATCVVLNTDGFAVRALSSRGRISIWRVILDNCSLNIFIFTFPTWISKVA